MKPFENNIASIYGNKGKQWLTDVPHIIKIIAKKWHLSDLQPVKNMSYNYVLAGMRGNQPVILKLGLDVPGLNKEASALTAFANFGAVDILEQEDGALLLERAVPGNSLKSHFPDKDHEAIQITCAVMKKLHQAPLPAHATFPHISDWLAALDQDWDVPEHYLEKARNLKNHLLETSAPPVLLHGDLHHDNILQSHQRAMYDSRWVVIDPKGVIGEPAYEVAVFIRNPIRLHSEHAPGLLDSPDALSIIANRISGFATNLGLDAERITQWCFTQAVLSWVWCLEDKVDPSYFKHLTEIFAKLTAQQKF